jgi:hypothetical protein
VKQVTHKISYNGELFILQQGCCRAHHIHVGDPQDVNSVSAETIQKFCILAGATGSPILSSHSLLLTVQLHWIAEHTERTIHSTTLRGLSCGWCSGCHILNTVSLLLWATPAGYITITSRVGV